MLNLTTNVSHLCPEVVFTCSAIDLPSTTLRWFISGELIATYAFIPNVEYPVTVEVENATLNTLAGSDVDIQILEASLNEDDPDIASFISIMTVNTSALGSAIIGCGIFSTMSTLTLNYTRKG